MRIVLVTMGVIVGSWVVFWGVAGVYLARRRSMPAWMSAALAVLLGPIGVGILLLRSRRAASDQRLPAAPSEDLV